MRPFGATRIDSSSHELIVSTFSHTSLYHPWFLPTPWQFWSERRQHRDAIPRLPPSSVSAGPPQNPTWGPAGEATGSRIFNTIQWPPHPSLQLVPLSASNIWGEPASRGGHWTPDIQPTFGGLPPLQSRWVPSWGEATGLQGFITCDTRLYLMMIAMNSSVAKYFSHPACKPGVAMVLVSIKCWRNMSIVVNTPIVAESAKMRPVRGHSWPRREVPEHQHPRDFVRLQLSDTRATRGACTGMP